MSETVDEFLEAAWNDHTSDPRGTAARLADARALLEREPGQFGPFVQFAEHLLLGHLADADALEPWLELAARHPDAAPAVERARLAARLLRGDTIEPGAQPAVLQVRALGTAICGSTARGDLDRARGLLDAAMRIGRTAGGDALKSLAAACNNVASQLLDGAREPRNDALMLEAAEAARETWGQAGTWMNVERAEYLLARCAAAAGDGAKAAGHARACLSVCDANGADAFERFFGHEAMAHALSAQGDRAAAAGELQAMRRLLDDVGDTGLRAYAQSSLDKLQALVNPA